MISTEWRLTACILGSKAFQWRLVRKGNSLPNSGRSDASHHPAFPASFAKKRHWCLHLALSWNHKMGIILVHDNTTLSGNSCEQGSTTVARSTRENCGSDWSNISLKSIAHKMSDDFRLLFLICPKDGKSVAGHKKRSRGPNLAIWPSLI